MNVDLPAPLGPSRPVTPGGTVTVTSFRPMTCPYHFETCSAVTTGVIILSRGFAPRTPLHALSLAASPARFRLRESYGGRAEAPSARRRADRVARSLSLARR